MVFVQAQPVHVCAGTCVKRTSTDQNNISTGEISAVPSAVPYLMWQ